MGTKLLDDLNVKTLLHLHMPRTAGTAIYQHLLPALPGGRRMRYKDMPRLREAVAKGGETALVSGHFMWGVHELFPDFVYFVVLRDPVDRVASTYSYILKTPAHPKHEVCKNSSLSEVLSQTGRGSQFENGQTRQILGESFRGRPLRGGECLDAALERLSSPNVVVGTMEDLPGAVARLSAALDIEIPPFPTTVVNSAPRISMDAETRVLIACMNVLDTELYRHAATSSKDERKG